MGQESKVGLGARVTLAEAQEKAIAKPSLGRIVLYNSSGKLLPAIVVNVIPGYIPIPNINVRVFTDDGESMPWKYGVPYGTEPGQWQWPTRL